MVNNEFSYKKLFDPTAKDINWGTSPDAAKTKKQYLAASIALGIITLGIGHGVYAITRAVKNKITKDNPDSKEIPVGINENGKIKIQERRTLTPVKNEHMNKKFNEKLNTLMSLKPGDIFAGDNEDGETFHSLGLADPMILGNSIGISYHGDLDNQNSVATVFRDPAQDYQLCIRSGKIGDMLTGNIPNIEIISRNENNEEKTHFLGRDQQIKFQYGENEIKFNDKTIFRFNLSKPQ